MLKPPLQTSASFDFTAAGSRSSMRPKMRRIPGSPRPAPGRAAVGIFQNGQRTPAPTFLGAAVGHNVHCHRPKESRMADTARALALGFRRRSRNKRDGCHGRPSYPCLICCGERGLRSRTGCHVARHFSGAKLWRFSAHRPRSVICRGQPSRRRRQFTEQLTLAMMAGSDVREYACAGSCRCLFCLQWPALPPKAAQVGLDLARVGHQEVTSQRVARTLQSRRSIS